MLQRLMAFFAILLVAFTVLVSWASLRMNLGEIAWQLQKQEFIEGNLTRMYLVARFVDQRKLYLEQIDRGTFDRGEFQLARILDQVEYRDWNELIDVSELDELSHQIVNHLRVILNKAPLADIQEAQSLKYLDMGFRLERSREYAQALEVFKVAESYIRDPLLLGVVMLHQGYCNALLGNISAAKRYYSTVIREHRNTDQGVTASLLLQHLNQILVERQNLIKSDLSQLAKAKKAPLLMQCHDVLDTLDPMGVGNHVEKAEMLYVRGLCEEETGQKVKALKSYMGAIQSGGRVAIVRDANRRVFMMSSQIKNGGELKKLTKKLNESLKDKAMDLMHQLDSSVETENEQEEKVIQVPDTTLQQIVAVAQDVVNQRYAELKAAREAQAREEELAKALAEKKRKEITVHSYVKIQMKNGNTFSGEILSLDDENVIRLKTMIGVIGIRRLDIQRITKE